MKKIFNYFLGRVKLEAFGSLLDMWIADGPLTNLNLFFDKKNSLTLVRLGPSLTRPKLRIGLGLRTFRALLGRGGSGGYVRGE
jgi:hypothetical protein